MSYFTRYIEEQNERRARINHRANLRMLRDASDPYGLPAFRFVKLFRLNKGTVQLLITKLEPLSRQSTIPFRLKLLCALHFYGHGSYQVAAGSCHILALSQPSASRCIHEITGVICTHLLDDIIKFPQDALRQAETKEGFARKFQMPGVLGAIDGCHVAIIAPPEDDNFFRGNLFRNRKGYHSINVLACCDSNMRINYANARFPGSVHDSAIWMTSQIRRYFIENYTNVTNQSTILLGDSGFPLEPWLLVPCHNPENGSNKCRYNQRFIRARNIVEKCFGLVKSRFRCLLRHRTLHYHPMVACKIIYAVFVLHNLCIDNSCLDDEMDGYDSGDSDLPEDELNPESNLVEFLDEVDTSINIDNSTWYNLGCRLRESYINKYFN